MVHTQSPGCALRALYTDKTMQNLAIVYGAVIDDVLSKVRSEFVQEGNE